MNRLQNLACLLALCILLLPLGCGKKGNPKPQDHKNAFQWESARASFTQNGCLALNATMSGATQNVSMFTLELEPLGTPQRADLPPELQSTQDSCEGCPFMPREVQELTPQEDIPQENGTTQFAFTYCPQNKAAAFRWRLVARNVFLHFPYAISPVQTIRY